MLVCYSSHEYIMWAIDKQKVIITDTNCINLQKSLDYYLKSVII